MLRRLSLLVFFLAPLALSAQEVSFEAFANARQILIKSYFDVTFTLKNADGREFRPPSISDFTVVAGPVSSVRTTIINGQVSKEVSYTYTLQAKKLGKFIIGPARVKVGNKTLGTDPISVEVVVGSSKAEYGAEEVFIRAIPSVTQAYVGQQVTLDYKLYTTLQIDSYNVLEESDYQGFYAQDVRRYDAGMVREVMEGTQYYTKVFKRVALFPQRAGTLTVDPLNIQLGVVKEGSRQRSFFFNPQVQRVPASSDPVSIEVVSLPADAPPSFNGAVGNYNLQSSANPTTLTTDDALSLLLTITGNGDIKRVQAPELPISDDFEVYDPKVLSENVYERSGQVMGEKTFEYLLVPKLPGEYQLNPQFSWFDPDSSAYITAKMNTYSLIVRPGSMVTKPAPSRDKPVVQEDINYLKTDTRLSRQTMPFFGSSLFWILSVVPFLFLGSALVYKRIREYQSQLDPAVTQRKLARKVALKRLSTAEQHLQTNSSRAFYDEVSKAMLGYVCAKLQIPLSELTKDNVRDKLQSLSVPALLIDQFMKIIKTCEMALFAGQDHPAAMQENYERSVEVLSDIEVYLKK